ncbi:MAG TPA: YraN family protein [Acidimicrobiales bacterium]|nr:YraN family protein [Acidimicrobiales bacterium]
MGPTPDRPDRRLLGAVGEGLAAEWYRARGFEVLDRNWRCRLGEIDLVCRSGDLLVICEVKSRSSDSFGAPVEAVTLAKRRRLRRLGTRWLAEHRVRCDRVRFDVVSVLGDRVGVVEDAF